MDSSSKWLPSVKNVYAVNSINHSRGGLLLCLYGTVGYIRALVRMADCRPTVWANISPFEELQEPESYVLHSEANSATFLKTSKFSASSMQVLCSNFKTESNPNPGTKPLPGDCTVISVPSLSDVARNPLFSHLTNLPLGDLVTTDGTDQRDIHHLHKSASKRSHYKEKSGEQKFLTTTRNLAAIRSQWNSVQWGKTILTGIQLERTALQEKLAVNMLANCKE